MGEFEDDSALVATVLVARDSTLIVPRPAFDRLSIIGYGLSDRCDGGRILLADVESGVSTRNLLLCSFARVRFLVDGDLLGSTLELRTRSSLSEEALSEYSYSEPLLDSE